MGYRLLIDSAITENGDLIWTGSGGWYGRVRVPGERRDRYVHRVAYELYHGPIPEGLTIDHVHANGCRNRYCFLKAHLEAVTQGVNNQRQVHRTHCPSGHAFTEENTYWINATKNGKTSKNRRCKTCVSAQMKKQYQKKKASATLDPGENPFPDSPFSEIGDSA